MASMVERMLDIADDLVRTKPKSAAARRRAVSTAYYAAFHALAKLCAQELLGDEKLSSDTFRRVYRALEHGALRNAKQKPGPLRDGAALREIFDDLVQLQSEREAADYDPPDPAAMNVAIVKENIVRASTVVDRIAKLSSGDRRTMAVNLLIKERFRAG